MTLLQQSVVHIIDYSCCCDCVAVAVISPNRIIAWWLLWEFFARRLIACLLLVNMFSQKIRSIYVGIHDPLSAETNVDHSDRVHVAFGALQQ